MFFKPVSAHRAHPWAASNSFEAAPARAIDLWDAWLFATADATLALAAWSSAPEADKAASYSVYVAALDREEQAARMLHARLQA